MVHLPASECLVIGHRAANPANPAGGADSLIPLISPPRPLSYALSTLWVS